MGTDNYTYEIPDKLNVDVANFIRQNGDPIMAQHIRTCDIECEELGLAYYEGLTGDTWNKKALDLTISGQLSDIEYLQAHKVVIRDKIQKVLHPSKSGLLIKNIFFQVNDVIPVIDLLQQEESLDLLSQDIQDAIARGEPSFCLDRLHTYATKYLRNICSKHGLSILDGDNYYPLHSLMGSLVKYYEKNNFIQSDFTKQALKMSISTFEKYNGVRNNQSYAHDNDVLNNTEAIYVIEVVNATLKYIRCIEENHIQLY